MRGRVLDDASELLGWATIIMAVIFLLTPMVVTGIMAFDGRHYLATLPPPNLSLQWFRKFFADDYFIRGLRTSLLLALWSVVVSVILGVFAALGLSTAFPGRDLLTSALLSPLIVPPLVIGFALLLLTSAIGVSGFPRLVFGHVILTLPYTVRATMAGLVGIGETLTEAALCLGATRRQALFDITLPLARTGIVNGAIFAFAISMDDVAISLMLTDAHTVTLPLALLSAVRANFDLTIAASATLLMLMTVGLVLILERSVGLRRVVGQGMFPSASDRTRC